MQIAYHTEQLGKWKTNEIPHLMYLYTCALSGFYKISTRIFLLINNGNVDSIY